MLTTVSTGIFEGMQAKPIGLHGVRGFYAPQRRTGRNSRPKQALREKKCQRNAQVSKFELFRFLVADFRIMERNGLNTKAAMILLPPKAT